MVDLRKIDPTKANLDHEKSQIRHLKPNDSEEKKRLWEIETDPVVGQFVEDLSQTEAEMVEFTTLEKNYLVLAVEGKAGYVDETEVGKLQGWITVYPEKQTRLARLQKHGLADLIRDEFRVLEMGFARHPKAKPGQIASAVRQTLALLHEEHQKDAENELVVTAYADETNEASERVLIASGFVKKGKVKYHVKNISYDYLFIWRKV